MGTPNRSVTQRGFTTYDQFTDTYGNEVTIRQSSSAEGPRVWLLARHLADRALPDKFRMWLKGLTDAEVEELAAFLTPSPHLDVEQARRARDALDAFIAESEAR
jgi:hypothetical protein